MSDFSGNQRVLIPPVTESASKLDASGLCALFDALFGDEHRTELVGGATEPLYQPSRRKEQRHCIVFTRDYCASALHEVAHWCIAGPARRRRQDYGYWYTPDGRNVEQQQAFEKAEVKPQALEWMFCMAAGVKFRVSADNLDGDGHISDAFRTAIWAQTQHYCRAGMPPRGRRFAEALYQYYGGGNFADPRSYTLGALL